MLDILVWFTVYIVKSFSEAERSKLREEDNYIFNNYGFSCQWNILMERFCYQLEKILFLQIVIFIYIS